LLSWSGKKKRGSGYPEREPRENRATRKNKKSYASSLKGKRKGEKSFPGRAVLLGYGETFRCPFPAWSGRMRKKPSGLIGDFSNRLFGRIRVWGREGKRRDSIFEEKKEKKMAAVQSSTWKLEDAARPSAPVLALKSDRRKVVGLSSSPLEKEGKREGRGGGTNIDLLLADLEGHSFANLAKEGEEKEPGPSWRLEKKKGKKKEKKRRPCAIA